MNALKLNLTAPRRAVEPRLLAQRLPLLGAALARCVLKKIEIQALAPHSPAAVHVFAAQLGVQRNHVSLETLPLLNPSQRDALQRGCVQWCAEVAPDLVFTPCANDDALVSSAALGSLNLNLALPSAAQFISRDVATALPKTPDSQALRQLFNASQMALHQSPLSNSPVNSLWFSNPPSLDALGASYLHGGLSAWWDALPAWDAAQAAVLVSMTSKQTPFTLHFIGADYELQLACEPKSSIKFWQKPAQLQNVLQMLGE